MEKHMQESFQSGEAIQRLPTAVWCQEVQQSADQAAV